MGLAATLVALASQLGRPVDLTSAEFAVLSIEIYLCVVIGTVTFVGSLVAFAKLHGLLFSRPFRLSARNVLNILIFLAMAWLASEYIAATEPAALSSRDTATAFGLALSSAAMSMLRAGILVATVFGVHFVVAIGGADMPVVSVLNSFSGWATAATGFLLGNDLLIVFGALVGSSGALLSYIMCRAMNRSITNIVLGGFGTDGSQAAESVEGDPAITTLGETVSLLTAASNVVVVPGYGMAVAQAQSAVSEMTDALRQRGVNVRFAIHPVAGRLPGHMNVLLADADVPYDIVLDMDEINKDFPETDAVLAIRANDFVNSGAAEDPASPIAGMPVLEVWKAKMVIVLKRSITSGYVGVDNPLFFKENTRMLFGDAKESVQAVLSKVVSP